MSGDSDEDLTYVESEDLFSEEGAGPTTFLDELCYRVEAFVIVFSLSAVFFIFGLVSLFVTVPGTANNVVAVINFYGTGLFTLGSLAVIVVCKARMD